MAERQYFDVDPTEIVWVQATRATGPAALFEKDPAHPDGQVFVAGERPVRVALTQRVVEALDARALRVVSQAEAEAEEARLQEQQATRLLEARRQEREAKRALFVRAVGSDKGFDALVPAV